MAYKLLIKDRRIWDKDCNVIPPKHLRLILGKIRALECDPWAENVQVKQLKQYALADFRLRVGEYRVLFDKDEDAKTILLYRVLHRSKLY